MKKAIVIRFSTLYLFFNSLKTQIYNGECRAHFLGFQFCACKNWKVLKAATVLLFISTLIVLVSSCKKYSKELTTVNFHVLNPISGEGLAGVHVSIVEQEDITKAFQVESKYETRVIWEGETDADGKASYSFNAMKKDKFEYWQSVDNSSQFN